MVVFLCIYFVQVIRLTEVNRARFETALVCHIMTIAQGSKPPRYTSEESMPCAGEFNDIAWSGIPPLPLHTYSSVVHGTEQTTDGASTG